jgi:hypothetical protein
MGIKFLGSASSHSYDHVNIDGIEVAFGIMDRTLSELFSGRKEDIEILTKRLNDNFHPDSQKEEPWDTPAIAGFFMVSAFSNPTH